MLVNHIVDCYEDSTTLASLAMLEQVPAPTLGVAAPRALLLTADVPPDRAQATGGRALRTSGRRVMPALGLHWAHCVSTRLFLSRATPAGALRVGDAVSRRLRVVFAPHLPPGDCKYAVTTHGVRGIEEDAADAPPSPS